MEVLPPGFKKIQENCFVKTQVKELFDGAIDDFGGVWSKAEFSKDKLILSRDRVGGRFIYYYEDKEVFCFANTVKQLLRLDFVNFKVCKKGAFQFLVEGKVRDMIQGIKSLKANSSLEVNLHTFHKNEIENHDENDFKEIEEEEEAIKLIRNPILDKVSAVSSSADNLASMLSGGIDSSVIASSLYIKGKCDQIPFITAITSDDNLNELQFAKSVVSKLGITTWHQILAQNVDQEIENLHRAMEFPTTSLGSFLQYEIMRFCHHKGITEILDGTGADALFAGHNYYHTIYWNELIRKGQFLRAIKLSIASQVASNNFTYYWKNMFKYFYIPRLGATRKLRFAIRNNPLIAALNPQFINENYDFLRNTSNPSLKLMNPFLKVDFFQGAVEELLRFGDRIGKYFGVINRPIFAESPSIYKAAFSISSDLKFKDGYSKYILRKAFEDILPHEVLDRRDKMGLVAPNNTWMKMHKDLFLSYFTEDLSDFFDVPSIKKMIEKEIDDSGRQENYKIFRFISFAIWFKVMSN